MFQRWVLNIAVFMAFLPAVSYAAIPSTNYVNNADHLSGGMVDSERIAVYNKYDKNRKNYDGTKTFDVPIEETVAAGNDVRFNTVQIGQAPTITSTTGDSTDRAVIWIE